MLSPVKLRKVCQSGNKEGKRLLLKTSNSASVSCFYRDKQGIKGLPPLSPAPQIPAEAPPLRSGKPSSLRMVVDEAEHFPAQSACQRRFAPTAVRLHRNAVRLPAGIDVHLQRNTHPGYFVCALLRSAQLLRIISEIRFRAAADIMRLRAGAEVDCLLAVPGGRPRRLPVADDPPLTPSNARIAASSLLRSCRSC